MRKIFVLIVSLVSIVSWGSFQLQAQSAPPHAVAPAAAAANAAAPASAPEGAVSDVTVQGQAKDKITVEKHKPKPKIELEEIVDPSSERTEKFLAVEKKVPSDQDFDAYSTLRSIQVARVALPFIPEPPLLTYYPEALGFSVKTWKLDVTDDNGNVVFEMTGKGNPVHPIHWEGRDSRGKMVRVGTLYGYKFICVDAQGAPHTTIGETFELDSVKYVDGKSVVVEISNKSLYGRDNDTVAPGSALVLEKALDILREYSRYPFTIELHSNPTEESLADGRMRSLREFIMDHKPIQPSDLRTKTVKADLRGSVTRFIIATNKRVYNGS